MEARATTRFALTLHYDGSDFCGWQIQPDQRTVQGELAQVLSRLADAPRTVIGSGRTDTGVHARGQVAAVDMPDHWTPPALRRALNALLPHDIWVARVQTAPPGFHPRYDALERTYTYHVGLAEESASPFHRRWCWPLGEALNPELLRRAAALLPGRRSFEAFAKAGQPERGTVCRVDEARWSEWELGAVFQIRADRYLHHMVRYLVGTMVDVARGRRSLAEMRALLEGGEGTTSPPAPPQGLTLVHVAYPSELLAPPPATADGTETSHPHRAPAR